MDDLIFKHEAELLLQHPLSRADSTAGDFLVPFVLYLVIEAVRGGEVDVRGTGYKIMNSDRKGELRIKRPVGPPEDRETKNL